MRTALIVPKFIVGYLSPRYAQSRGCLSHSEVLDDDPLARELFGRARLLINRKWESGCGSRAVKSAAAIFKVHSRQVTARAATQELGLNRQRRK